MKRSQPRLTSRCPDCFGFLQPAHYDVCASCDGERLPLDRLRDRRDVVWPTVLILFRRGGDLEA